VKIKVLLVTVLVIAACLGGGLAGCSGTPEGLLPQFTIGDQWVSRWYTGGVEYLVTSDITGEEMIEGRDCYIMETVFDPPYQGAVSSMINKYDKTTMNIVRMELVSTTPGEFTTANYQISGDPAYPVIVGREYREVEAQTLTWGNSMVSQSENSTATTVTKVEKIENITVAAGTFKCFKMLKYDEAGNLIQISWRSGDTKMFQVKMTDMMEPDAVYELVSCSMK
jgi:hypothetical protein